MASSPKHQENPILPSPKIHSPLSSSSPNTPQPVPFSRSESINPYPTTFVQADSSSFKQVVQLLTGSSETVKLASSGRPAPAAAQPDPNPKNHIPPIKSIPKTRQQQSGFRLYERRSSFKNLKIGPLNQFFVHSASVLSPRKPEILSPSILDFPSLVLSPVTPLLPDPFDRSRSANFNDRALMGTATSAKFDAEAEEKAIKEKGFYLHPSPTTTPRDSEPRLLPLFPVTSPRVSGSSSS